MSLSRTPTLGELLNVLRDGIFRDLRVSLPGRIESYDPSTQTADVQPLVGEVFDGDDGQPVKYQLPVVTSVPILFQGGGGFRVTFPLAAGDNVLLVFGDRSLDTYLSGGGITNPDTQRRHNLSDAFAIPGLHPTNAAWTGAEAGVVTIGKDGQASDFVALSSHTESRLSNLESAMNAHVHSVASFGPTTPATAAVGGIPVASTGAVASATVKVAG